MPNMKGARRKKVVRPIVLPSIVLLLLLLILFLMKYQMSLLSVVHLWGWRDSPRSLILNLVPRNRRHSDNWHWRRGWYSRVVVFTTRSWSLTERLTWRSVFGWIGLTSLSTLMWIIFLASTSPSELVLASCPKYPMDLEPMTWLSEMLTSSPNLHFWRRTSADNGERSSVM